MSLFGTNQLFIRAMYVRSFCKTYPEIKPDTVLKLTGIWKVMI